MKKKTKKSSTKTEAKVEEKPKQPLSADILARIRRFCDENGEHVDANVRVALESVRVLAEPENEHVLTFDFVCQCGKTHGDELDTGPDDVDEDGPDEEAEESDEDESDDDEDDSDEDEDSEDDEDEDDEEE